MTRPLTVLFLPESAYGPTNQCVGLGRILLDRGHRVVFAAESSWRGRLAPLGFVEALVDLATPGPDACDGSAGQFWIDFIDQTAPEFRKPTIEQLRTFVQRTYQALIDGARYCEPRLAEIIAEYRPDVVVQPVGDPRDEDPTGVLRLPERRPYRLGRVPRRVRRDAREDVAEFDAWVQEQGAPPLAPREFMHPSPTHNIYVYPRELDYVDARPLDATWHRIDSSVRETDAEYPLPAAVADRPAGSALVYLSLGSLGGADVALMQRLIDVLGTTDHRFVVSLGPRAGELRLPATMVGEPILPQTKVIPQVDLVITHGGNNTVTEAMHFGKPMVLLPLFWDQYDNAQRVAECGFGVRLSTYGCTDDELTGAVERLLADASLRNRLDEIGAAIRGRDGLRRGADLIEDAGRTHRAR